jgi:hypothetical protein
VKFSRACIVLALAAAPFGLARAQSVGRAVDGLPGLQRLPLAEVAPTPLAAAVALGYGRTEAQPGEIGAHQRLLATAAIGAAPLPTLQLSARLDGRYDRHPPDSAGANSGTVLSPTLLARWIKPLGSAVAAGAEAGVWFPGSESIEATLSGASPQLALFGSWRAGSWILASLVGYRLDRSAAARPTLAHRRFGDRLALGLSDFDAAQLGLGAAYRLGQDVLFAELNAQLLVGSRAPPLRQDPLMISLGARRQLPSG